MSRLPLDIAQKQRAIKLYTEEKLSSNTIAKRFGCSPNAIRNLLSNSGVKMRTHQERNLIVEPSGRTS